MKTFYSVALLLLLSNIAETELTVHTSHGFIDGASYPVGPFFVHGFRNIPFAEKPIGSLRFQLPEKNEKKYDIQGTSTSAQHRCVQLLFSRHHHFRSAFEGDEDCLFLDVYVRQENDLENSSLPVLVYFHGGGFVRGSKEDYGPDFLLRFGNVVLVVPNYRLGILGFLNGHDSALHANLGLWDQRLALRWVSENIDRFGGDPGKVTIAGHEAGGMSVGLHVLSHASQEYFQNAISISGCALTPSLFDDLSPALEVTRFLKCSETFDYLACLQTADLRSFVEIQANSRQESFLPSVDIDAQDSFIPMHPQIMYHKGCQKNVKYLIGYAENEVSAEVKKEFPKTLKYQHLDKMFGHFLGRYFGHSPNFDAIVRAVKYHYMKGVFIPTFESIEPRVVSILTDFLHKTPLEQLRIFHGQENTFLYLFEKDDAAFCGPGNRPCYGDEFYLFSRRSTAHYKTGVTGKAPFTESVSTVWKNFISYGHPDPNGTCGSWDHIEVSDVIRPKSDRDRIDVEFWSSLVHDLVTAENITEHEPADAHLLHDSTYTIFGWGAAGLAILCSVLCVALIGLVIITKRRNLAMSVLPASARKDVKFSRVYECA